MASLRRKPRSPYWWACFTAPGGRRLQRSTKLRDDGKSRTRREAQRLADAWEEAGLSAQRLRHANDVAREIFSRGDETQDRVGDFLERWLQKKSGSVATATLSVYESTVRAFLAVIDERRLLASISADDFDAVCAAHPNWSTGTANRSLSVLRTAFASSKITPNPFSEIKKQRHRPTVERRPFTPEEMAALLGCATPEWASMIRFGYYTGQRLRDIATLRWRSVDVEARRITLTTNKTRRRMQCGIPSGLMDHIATLPTPAFNDAPIHPDADAAVQRLGMTAVLSAQFRRLLVSAGIDDRALSYHCLRYTTTTALKSAGVPSAVAQEIIGHDTRAISDSYTVFGEDVMRDAIERIPRI